MTDSFRPLRLTMLILSLLLLLSVVSYGWFSWKDVRRSVTQELHQQNAAFIGQTEAFFRLQEQLLLSVGLPLVQDNRLRRSELQAALERLSSTVPQIRGLAVLDRRGELLLGVGAEVAPDISLGSSDAITQARYTEHLKLGATFLDSDSDALLPAFMALPDADGNVLALAVALYSVNGNNSIWQNLQRRPGTHLWLLGDDGKLRFAYPMTGGILRDLANSKVDSQTLGELRQHGGYGMSGDAFSLSLDGEPVVVQSQLLPQYDFVSAAFLPMSQMFWLWLGKVQSVGTVVALFLLVALLVYRLIWLAGARLVNARITAESNLLKLSQAIEQSQDSVVVTDSSWCIEYANRRFEGEVKQDEARLKGVPVTNFSPHDMLRDDLPQIQGKVLDNGSWCGERQRAGTEQWYEFSISLVELKDTESVSFILIGQDISERKAAEALLYQQANFDSLTQLPNRRRASELITQALEEAWSDRAEVALLYLDLDNFKQINDTFGHLFGDQVLVKVAQRLQQVLGDEGHLSHMSGDEFLIHFGYASRVQIEQRASRIIDAFRSPLKLQGKNLSMSISIGISCYPTDSPDVQGLIRDADLALYESKRCGRGRFTFFDAELDKRMKRRLEIEHQLPIALQNGDLFMVYQSKNSIESGEILGFEALMRLDCRALGAVGPDEFIEVAEDTGLIDELGRFALRKGCEDLARFQAIGGRSLTMAINVSVRQLTDDSIVDYARQMIADTGIDPTMLELEITESLLAENLAQVMPRLEQLRALGLSLTIDDFGTGYSSLSYLTRFPVATLKIDKCFVDDLVKNANDATVVRTIVQMGHALGLKVVAEGLEDESQWRLLRQFGCDIGQGYLFSKPLDYGQAERLLQTTAKIPLLRPAREGH
jgi:diguanylate cyclase (GGDEF)-like protein/PAS domain S-box-containing protein